MPSINGFQPAAQNLRITSPQPGAGLRSCSTLRLLISRGVQSRAPPATTRISAAHRRRSSRDAGPPSPGQSYTPAAIRDASCPPDRLGRISRPEIRATRAYRAAPITRSPAPGHRRHSRSACLRTRRQKRKPAARIRSDSPSPASRTSPSTVAPPANKGPTAWRVLASVTAGWEGARRVRVDGLSGPSHPEKGAGAHRFSPGIRRTASREPWHSRVADEEEAALADGGRVFRARGGSSVPSRLSQAGGSRYGREPRRDGVLERPLHRSVSGSGVGGGGRPRRPWRTSSARRSPRRGGPCSAGNMRSAAVSPSRRGRAGGVGA